MKLGLEHLVGTKLNSSAEDLIAVYGGMYQSVDDVFATVGELEKGCFMMEQLLSIQNTIDNYGCTESLMFLYGDNDITMSVEGVGEAISKAYNWVIEKLKKLYDAVVGFFKKLFGVNKKNEETATAAEKVAKNVKVGTPPQKQKAAEPSNKDNDKSGGNDKPATAGDKSTKLLLPYNPVVNVVKDMPLVELSNAITGGKTVYVEKQVTVKVTPTVTLTVKNADEVLKVITDYHKKLSNVINGHDDWKRNDQIEVDKLKAELRETTEKLIKTGSSSIHGEERTVSLDKLSEEINWLSKMQGQVLERQKTYERLIDDLTKRAKSYFEKQKAAGKAHDYKGKEMYTVGASVTQSAATCCALYLKVVSYFITRIQVAIREMTNSMVVSLADANAVIA